MAHIAPVWPNDGDPGWGDVLNTALDTITNQINSHDDLIASIGGGTVTPPATTTTLGVVQLAGDLTGTAGAPVLVAVTTPGTVGGASAIPVITYDAQGRITQTSTATIDGGVGVAGPKMYSATWSDLGSVTLAFPVTLTSFTSAVGKVFIFGNTANTGTLLTSYEGTLFVSAASNSTDPWSGTLSDILAPTGFNAIPTVTIGGSGDTRTVMITFAASSSSNAGGSCQVWI